MTINFYVFSKSQTLKMLTAEFCSHHNHRMKNRIYRISTPTIIILFYFSQSSSEWYVLAMQCTILLFCLCFINILSQYQVMELSYGTLCQISFPYAEMEPTWNIFISCNESSDDNWQLISCNGEVIITIPIRKYCVLGGDYYNQTFNFLLLKIKVNTPYSVSVLYL